MKPAALKRPPGAPSANRRLTVWYGVLIFVLLIFITRLFYLQIVRHDHYRDAALNDQLKQYSIAPERGIIEAQNNGAAVPIVLNQKLYTLYADPTLIKDKDASGNAAKLALITKDNPITYTSLMKTKNTRYVILAKRIDQAQSDQITKLKLPGVGTQGQDYRTYPQGGLAAQVLGYVDDGGQGQYGVEQYFNKQLSGTPGKLKAITDVNGVPLAASHDNVKISPKAGNNIDLTLNVSMQQQLETILQNGVQQAHSQNGSAIIMDPNTGAIEAMANWPSYDPAKFYDVKDFSAFSNAAVSSPLEVGSIMKTLTISSGLNLGVITPTSSYHDPGYVTIDGSTIKNVEPITSDQTTIQQVLLDSLNTGAVHVLSLMGGGQVNQQARVTWNDYMTNHWQLGKPTGIEQPNESAGDIPDPLNGNSLDLQYAETAFGQGMTATLLQMVSAFSAAVNGGTYYQPHLVASTTTPGGQTQNTKTKVVKANVISAKSSSELRDLLQYVFETNHGAYSSNLHPGYVIGGKTGTAQVAQPGGGYSATQFNGDFMGFVGGDKPQYVVAVLVNTPDIPSYQTAGAAAAAPIFGKIADMLVNVYGAVPKSN